MGDLFELIDRGIPVGVIIVFVIGLMIGRLWQWSRDRGELERQIDLIAELVTQLQNQIIPDGYSPLAKAIMTFQQSVAGERSSLANKIPAICIHGQHPDDCGVCRH